MFIDDTGDVKNIASNHPQQRYAGITGVIFEMDYLRETFEPSFLKLKEKHFGINPEKGRPPILHLRKMKAGVGAFTKLLDGARRAAWEDECLSMYRRAKYTVVTMGVDKIAFYAKYPNWNDSIYALLVGNVIERYFYFLRFSGSGDVMAAAVNDKMDRTLRDLYKRFYNYGTDHIPADRLRGALSSNEIKIKPQDSDVQGLQMADLLASTCLAHCKRTYANGPTFDPFATKVADLLERQKFYRSFWGDPNKYGRIWRP
jgi:hypothetical protein